MPNEVDWETLGGAPTFGRTRISYNYLPNKQPQFVFGKETFNEEVGRKIDRKVVFRNSEKNNTVRDTIEDPTLIGQASTFGSLKRFLSLIDEENPYWDSIMPLVDVSKDIDLSNFTPPQYGITPYGGMGWLLESITEKDGKQFDTSSVIVKVDGQNPSQYDTSNTIAYDYLMTNDAGDDVSFPPAGTIGSVTHDSYQVTNYLHRDFRGIEDFTRYTIGS